MTIKIMDATGNSLKQDALQQAWNVGKTASFLIGATNSVAEGLIRGDLHITLTPERSDKNAPLSRVVLQVFISGQLVLEISSNAFREETIHVFRRGTWETKLLEMALKDGESDDDSEE